jgi:hypothetical protein
MGKFKNGMVRAAEEACGRDSKEIKPKETPFWNERIAEETTKKNKAWRE